MLFQICMTLFFLWNTKEDILKKVSVFFVGIMKVCFCGSVVEHCVSSAKSCGFNSQGTHILTKKKCITRMQCKSLWIKVSAKCINVNVNRVQMGCCWPHLFSLYGQQSKPFSKYLLLCFAKEIVSQVWNDMKLWMFIFGWTMLLSLKMYTAHTHTHRKNCAYWVKRPILLGCEWIIINILLLHTISQQAWCNVLWNYLIY